MLQLAQDMLKAFQDRVRLTLGVVTDLAESMGAPATVTQMLHGLGRFVAPPVVDTGFDVVRAEFGGGCARAELGACGRGNGHAHRGLTENSPARAEWYGGGTSVRGVPMAGAETAEDAASDGAEEVRSTDSSRTAARKRITDNALDLTGKVRPLGVEDAIDGSTYLARIVWSLGVAELEGSGPLRPADIARMIMARSPVSLEPPNVARYIRRSKPSCIEIDRAEGSSSFYRLNEEGRQIFRERYRLG